MDKAIYLDNRIIGYLKGEIFLKNVLGQKHFLRKPPAIANDVSVLKDVEKQGATICHIVDKETGKSYYAYIKTIWKKGFYLDRGFGEQIALSMNWWSQEINHMKSIEEQAEQERLFK